MTAITHVAGGIVFTGFVLTNTLVELDATVTGITIFAALLPDIDHPRSTISKIVTLGGLPHKLEKKLELKPGTFLWRFFRIFHLPELIEQKFLHRGGIHSVLAGVIAAVVFYCFAFLLSDRPLALSWTFLNGYVSHLLLDIFNPTGVPFYYPIKSMVRLPENGEGCIPVGWATERWLFFTLIIPAIVMLVLAHLGIQTVLYRFNPSAYGAVAEIRKHEDMFYQAYISGYGERSLTLNEGRYNILGIRGRDDIVLERDGRVYFINQKGGNIATDRVVVEPLGPKKVEFKQIVLRQGVISQVQEQIGGYGFVNGEIEVRARPTSPVYFDDYPTVRIIPLPSGRYVVVMEYFPLSELRKLFPPSIFIHSGQLQITRISYEKIPNPKKTEGAKP